MSGSVKDQCAGVVRVLAKERDCYHQACSREKRDLKEENKTLKREIEELEETVAHLEAIVETTDKLRKFEQDTYREDLKQQKFRK